MEPVCIELPVKKIVSFSFLTAEKWIPVWVNDYLVIVCDYQNRAN